MKDIHIHRCIQIYTCIRSYIHTYIHTYIHIYIHTHIHIYIHTYIHKYIHTYRQRQIIADREQDHWLGIHLFSYLKHSGVFVHALTACRPRSNSCLLKLFSSHGCGAVRCGAELSVSGARLSTVLCKRLVTRNKVHDLRVTEKAAFGKSVTKCKGKL
jgi:hypothetical protein